MVLIIGLLIPLLGTMLGAAFVFLMKDEMPLRLQKTLLGFASGVMVAASVWSLLIPAIEMASAENVQCSMFNVQCLKVLPAAVGFLLGMGFLLMIDELTPHLHIGTDKPEGMRSHLSKTACWHWPLPSTICQKAWRWVWSLQVQRATSQISR